MDKIGGFFKALEEYGLFVGLLIAGFFGGLVSLRDKVGLERWEKFFTVLSGPLIANYVTPIVYQYIPLDNGIQLGIGFLVGYVGIEGVQTLWKVIKAQIVKNKDE